MWHGGMGAWCMVHGAWPCKRRQRPIRHARISLHINRNHALRVKAVPWWGLKAPSECPPHIIPARTIRGLRVDGRELLLALYQAGMLEGSINSAALALPVRLGLLSCLHNAASLS